MMTIQLSGIKKIYQIGDQEVAALNGIDLDIKKGEFAALMGPSGSGKSTLMNILGCLDRPTVGSYRLDGEDRVTQVEVRAGARRRGEVEIVEGLSTGDRIVIEGTGKVRQGAKVRIATESPA